MAAMLPDAAPQDAFERVRGLPFVELSSDGLVLHDTVREVVAAYLRASDPDRSRRYRIAAWRQLRDEVTRATSHEMWRYTADLLYILENPAVREGFFPTSEHLYFVDPARDRGLARDPRDRGSLRAARVGGDPRGVVAAAAGRVLDGPRRVGARRRVLGRHPGRPGSPLALRRRSARPDLSRPSPPAAGAPRPAGPVPRFQFAHPEDPNHALVIAALILDVKRVYMELRPELRRVYNVLPEQYGARRRRGRGSGSGRCSTRPVRFDGVAYYAHVLDFGPASVDGWLTRIIATELQVNEDSILDVAQHQLVLDDRRVALTKLEFEVFKYLFERPGDVVERASLLRDVWGYDYAGGSNVIEALVKSLRRKLGDRASAIETVRGVGYRFAIAA